MKFYKYQSCGNDFVIIMSTSIQNLTSFIRTISDRHYGIGCDGVIFINEHPLEMIYYNSDGSKAGMCGNGLRCAAQFYYNHINKKNQFSILTQDGYKDIYISNPMIHINMGTYQYKKYNTFYYVYIGVRHIVLIVKDLKTININKYKRLLTDYNISFVKIISRKHISIETYERGAGHTLGCSTGACACAIVTNKMNYTDNTLRADMRGGSVNITVDDHIYISGKAYEVYWGELKENPCD